MNCSNIRKTSSGERPRRRTSSRPQKAVKEDLSDINKEAICRSFYPKPNKLPNLTEEMALKERINKNYCIEQLTDGIGVAQYIRLSN
jgi:hypothetical protein